MSSRVRIATCTIVCCLLVAMVVGAATSAPFQIYNMYGAGGASSNVQYAIGDGNMFYGGQFTRVCAEAWGDEACNTINPFNGLPQGFKYGTPERFAGINPVVQATDPVMGNLGKTVMNPLNGYIYTAVGGTGGGLYQIAPGDWACAGGINKVQGAGTQYVEGMCNDGTYIYTTCNQANVDPLQYGTRQQVKKWAVTHTGGTWGGGTATEVTTGGWPVNVPTSIAAGVTAPAAFGHVTYDAGSGMLYATDRGTTAAIPGRVWEINPNTNPPTCTAICAPNTNGKRYNGAVRYGNQLFVLKINTAAPDTGNLFIYDRTDGAWPATPTTTINMVAYDSYSGGDCYSIGLKGDGTKAKYLWLAHIASAVSFFDLDPWGGTPRNLGDASNWKKGYPVYTTAVVTAVGVNGFFVENQERTVGARVAWAGTMPAVGKLVTIQGQGDKTDSGEKFVTASSVTEGATATPAVKPLFVTNKSLGTATGGAGLANDGMLVKISGKVTYTDEYTGEFGVDDGSGVLSSRAGVKGVKVLKADGTPLDVATYPVFLDMITGTPCRAIVTGIVRLEKLADGTIIRRIDARSDADIVVTPL